MGNPTEIAHGNVPISAVYQGEDFIWMKNPGRFTVDYPGLYVIDTLGRLYTKEDWLWWKEYNGDEESNETAVGIAVIYSENFMFGISKFDLCDSVNADDGNQPKMFSDPVKTGFRGYYRQTGSNVSADRYFNFGNDPISVNNLGYLPSKEQLDFIRLTPRHFNGWQTTQSDYVERLTRIKNNLYAYPNGERVTDENGNSYLDWIGRFNTPYKWPYDFSSIEEMLDEIGGERLSSGGCKWVADTPRNISGNSLVGRDVPIGEGMYAGRKAENLQEESLLNMKKWEYGLTNYSTSRRYGPVFYKTDDTKDEFERFEEMLSNETHPFTMVFHPSTYEAATGYVGATTNIYNNGGYYRYIFDAEVTPYTNETTNIRRLFPRSQAYQRIRPFFDLPRRCYSPNSHIIPPTTEETVISPSVDPSEAVAMWTCIKYGDEHRQIDTFQEINNSGFRSYVEIKGLRTFDANDLVANGDGGGVTPMLALYYHLDSNGDVVFDRENIKEWRYEDIYPNTHVNISYTDFYNAYTAAHGDMFPFDEYARITKTCLNSTDSGENHIHQGSGYVLEQ